MTRHPLILLSLLSFGCVQIPAAEGTRPANTDMDAVDARKDLDMPDLNPPDADMRPDPDMANDMAVDMTDMADMPAPTPCEDPDKHFVGVRDAEGTCTPKGAPGAACTSPSHCASGRCFGAVCVASGAPPCPYEAL